jgi:hypothetical protein
VIGKAILHITLESEERVDRMPMLVIQNGALQDMSPEDCSG